MRIVVIDNYDSFTYNLVYILRQYASEVSVFRNDKIDGAACLDYDAIVLSPGPGVPKDAGNLSSIIATCAGKVPMLGVCLGHQAIGEYLGGSLHNLDKVYHGVQTPIDVVDANNPLFQNLSAPFEVGRYHSWEVISTSDAAFDITATTTDGSIMALQNEDQKLYGIQFHPESILTPEGEVLIQNFLTLSKVTA